MRARFRRCPVIRIVFAASAGLAFAASQSVQAGDTNLNVYNWSEYIAKDTVPNFEKQTGIKVRYDSYDSDDTLQTKLLTGSSGYDIVVPTSNYLARQIQAGVYQKLDKSKIPNLANLDPVLMKMMATGRSGQPVRRAVGVGHDGCRLQRRGRQEAAWRQGADRQLGAAVRSGERVEAEGLRRVAARRA